MANQKQVIKPELLAPAGGIEAFKAAVNNGADAVYLGLQNFNARGKAENFRKDNLKEWVEYAAVYGVKVYLALNTLIKENEIKEALATMEFAYGAGVSAVILQDFGLARAAKKSLPYIKLHASTQMGIHNFPGAIMAKEMGFERIILARETLVSDIAEIKKNVDIEIECFVQGALCVSFSGNCYYSSFCAGESGNRGRCLQFCRKKYSAVGDNNEILSSGYLLSAKDLCLLPQIKSYCEAGVDSFKIEGRMRRPEYVGGAVSVYRKAIDNGGVYSQDDLATLKKLFNRGDYTEGYPENQSCQKQAPIIYPYIQGHIGFGVGKVLAVKNGKAELDCALKKGDGIKFLRGKAEVGTAVVSAGGNFTTFTGEVRSGDDVNLTSDSEFFNKFLLNNRKIPIDVKARFMPGENMRLNFSGGKAQSEIITEWEVQTARTAPVKAEELTARISALNDTPFLVNSITVETENAFAPVSAINAAKKACAENLRQNIIRRNIQTWQSGAIQTFNKGLFKTELNIVKKLLAAVDSLDILPALKGVSDWVIYCPDEYTVSGFLSFKKAAEQNGLKTILNLPVVLRGKDRQTVSRILELPDCEAAAANNISHFSLAKGKGIVAGMGLNIINSQAFTFPRILSYECASPFSEKDYICRYIHRPVLMTLTHCPNYTVGAADCSNCIGKNTFNYKDDHGLTMSLRRVKLYYCYRELRAQKPYVNTAADGASSFYDLVGVKSLRQAQDILSGKFDTDAFKHRVIN